MFRTFKLGNMMRLSSTKIRGHICSLSPYMKIPKEIPRSVIGIYPGGRNFATDGRHGNLLGADVIRVGIEGCCWIYPRKNEIIKNQSEL